MNEKEALKAMQRGDTDALGWFIGRYTPYVCAIISRIFGNLMSPSDVEETASDVFLAFWSAADRVSASGIKGYLGSIARNKAKNKCRAQGNDLPLDDDIILISGNTPESILEKKEQDALIRQAVLSMTQPDREIFLRFYFYYQPISQVAAEMSMNEATVKTRLRRGREHLKNVLQNDNITKGGSLNGAENIRPAGLHTR